MTTHFLITQLLIGNSLFNLVNMGYYINQKGKWVNNQPTAKKGEVVIHTVRKTWADVRFFYANIIDYVRVIMGVAATAMISNAPEWKNTIAFLIVGNVLLDWVDGPVARAYNQSSVMGCGWDWFADILAQYNLAMWCTAEKSPITLFVSVFSCVEIGCGLFDFAISATSVYPEQHESSNPFFAVENLLTPGGTYNTLGTAAWLVNTLYPVAVLLNWHPYIINAFQPLAYLYAWHEVCQVCFIVSCWTETTAAFGAGIQFVRSCTSDERKTLTDTFATCSKVMKVLDRSDVNDTKEIYWLNLYADGQFHQDVDKVPSFPAYKTFVENLIKENYEEDDPRHILSYGFIVGPANGDKPQMWHHDYAAGVSNIFVPMTQDTTNNATQFMRTPNGPALSFQKDEDQNYPPPHQLLQKEETTHVEITQVISEPFSILKLMPNVIHRGIANKENYDRILFFVSTSRTDRIPDIGESTYSKVDELGDLVPKRDKATEESNVKKAKRSKSTDRKKSKI